MAESKPDQWREALTKGYQPGHVRLRWFALAVVCFVAFAAVTHWWLWELVKADANPRPVDHPLSAVSGYATEATETPAAPPLQPTPDHDRLPYQDLEAMRRGEDNVFEALGWKVNEATHEATPPDDLVRQVAARFGRRASSPSSAPAAAASSTAPPATTQVVTPIPGVDQGGTR
jgi:hypothetical protein